MNDDEKRSMKWGYRQWVSLDLIDRVDPDLVEAMMVHELDRYLAENSVKRENAAITIEKCDAWVVDGWVEPTEDNPEGRGTTTIPQDRPADLQVWTISTYATPIG